MSGRTYLLKGKALDEAALKEFPAEAKFSWAQVRDWRAIEPAGLLEEIGPTVGLVTPSTSGRASRRGSRADSATPQCPVGPHPEPGLDVAIGRACGISQRTESRCSARRATGWNTRAEQGVANETPRRASSPVG